MYARGRVAAVVLQADHKIAWNGIGIKMLGAIQQRLNAGWRIDNYLIPHHRHGGIAPMVRPYFRPHRIGNQGDNVGGDVELFRFGFFIAGGVACTFMVPVVGVVFAGVAQPMQKCGGRNNARQILQQIRQPIRAKDQAFVIFRLRGEENDVLIRADHQPFVRGEYAENAGQVPATTRPGKFNVAADMGFYPRPAHGRPAHGEVFPGNYRKTVNRLIQREMVDRQRRKLERKQCGLIFHENHIPDFCRPVVGFGWGVVRFPVSGGSG